MLSLGSVLVDKYRIQGILGRGGMGAVYLAADRSGQPVAVKELRFAGHDPEDYQEAVRQFGRESMLLAALDHPGLVPVLDSFETNGRHYLVMAFVDGSTLAQIVKRCSGFLPLYQVLDWAQQLCQVLEYLHTRNPPVIFRDLKPSNIMVDREGRIRLIDFGIARLFQDEVPTQTIIRGVGSAGYAPVEQYGVGGTDPRSDIYAFGATLYTLLTQQVPPPVVSIVAGADSLKNPRSINPEVPRYLDAAVVRMMALRKEERYPSIPDAWQALRPGPGEEERPTERLEACGLPPATPMELEFPRLELGSCLVVRFVGPSRPPAGRVTGTADFVLFEPNASLEYTLGLALKTEADEHSGFMLVVGEHRHAIPDLELGFRAACVRLVARTVHFGMSKERILPVLREHLVDMAEHLLDHLNHIPETRQVPALACLEDLARHYASQNQTEVLERVYRRILEVQERHLGPEDDRVERSRLRLADLLFERGEFEQSRPLHRRCHARLAGHAEALLEAGLTETAIQQMRAALQVLQKASSPGDPELLRRVAALRELCQKQGEPAQGLIEEEVRLREAHAPEEPIPLAHLLMDLARCNLEGREFNRAETALRKAVEVLEKSLGTDHPELAEPLKLLADTLVESGRRNEATELHTRATILRYRRATSP
ncbi:MAG: protein kinase [Armatimonadetes bacterium]|nr:protein kinase [Armatimonadota bacterium]